MSYNIIPLPAHTPKKKDVLSIDTTHFYLKVHIFYIDI